MLVSQRFGGVGSTIRVFTVPAMYSETKPSMQSG